MPVESTHICSLAGIPGSQNVMIVKHFLNGAHLVEKKRMKSCLKRPLPRIIPCWLQKTTCCNMSVSFVSTFELPYKNVQNMPFNMAWYLSATVKHEEIMMFFMSVTTTNTLQQQLRHKKHSGQLRVCRSPTTNVMVLWWLLPGGGSPYHTGYKI